MLDGRLQFNAPNAAIAGLTVTGNLNGTNGTGSLAVAFAGGSMNLGGFSVSGSATLALGDSGGRPTLAMTVNGGRLSVPGLLTNATVSGSANQNGITSLSLGVPGFTLPVVQIDSATLSLVRVANTSTYQISAGLQVDVPGVANNLAVNGSFGSNGNGSLAMTVTALTVRSASITNGSFSLVKTGSAMALRASGTFTLFGVGLEVVQADLALTATTITGSLTIRPFGGAALSLGGWTIGGTLRLAFTGTTVTIEIDNGTVGIQGWGGAVDMDGSFSVPPTNGSSFTLSLPTGGLRLGASSSPFYATGTFKLSFTNNVGTLSVLNATLRWKDGATTIASAGVPSLSISTNGAVSATPLGSFGATLGSFSFTVPSVSLKIEPQGLNAALTLGAGSLSIPGLPTQTTPGFTIPTPTSTTTFALTLASSNIDLGIVSLQGALIFRRAGGVFKLSVQGHSSHPLGPIDPAVFSIEGLVDVKMQDLTIASDGSYAIDVAMPRFGGSDIGVVNGRLQVNRTAGPNGSFTASISGARLLVGIGQPIPLGSLTFDTNSRFDKTFDVPAVALGPYFRMSSAQMRVRHMPSGIVRADLVNPVNVAVFDGSGTLTLNDLRIDTDGTFQGTVTGRLALFGVKITSTTFNVRRQNGIIELRLAASAGETLDLGFGHQIKMSGEARSDGTFSFSGSMKVALSVSGFSIDGSADMTVKTGGIDGSASGSVCIIQCASASGSVRSDGRVRGTLVIANVVNADWRIYLKTEGVRVDLNRDGDWDDAGDISIGSTTSADDTPPTMPSPPNVTVNANLGVGRSGARVLRGARRVREQRRRTGAVHRASGFIVRRWRHDGLVQGHRRQRQRSHPHLHRDGRGERFGNSAHCDCRCDRTRRVARLSAERATSDSVAFGRRRGAPSLVEDQSGRPRKAASRSSAEASGGQRPSAPNTPATRTCSAGIICAVALAVSVTSGSKSICCPLARATSHPCWNNSSVANPAPTTPGTSPNGIVQVRSRTSGRAKVARSTAARAS